MFYLSGCRKNAKNITNQILRSNERKICHNAKYFDEKDIDIFPQNNTYKKYFDYQWYVW